MASGPKRKLRILYIANGGGLSESLGGSIQRSIEVSKRLSANGCEIGFLTTVGGYRSCLQEKLNANFDVVRCSLLKRNETSAFDSFIAYFLASLTTFNA